MTVPSFDLRVSFRTNIQPSPSDPAVTCWAVMLGLLECSTPCTLEMVSAVVPFNSHTMTVHWGVRALQVKRASSPRRTVSV